MKKNQKIKKIIINIIFFILLIILTFYFILKNEDLSKIYSILNSVNKKFIFIAIVSMMIYVLLEAININKILKGLGEKISITKSIKYTLIVFFFSAITPAASGGQPMCIYYMHKDNIKVAHSTLALLIQLCCFQLGSIILGIIGAIFNFNVLWPGLIYLFIIGLILNLGSLLLLTIGIFSRRMSKTIIKFLIKILKVFKIKSIKEKQTKLVRELFLYKKSAKYIKENKKIIIKIILVTLLQLLVYYSVPYWIYLSFGLDKYNIWNIVFLQALLYVTVSCIPSPGSVGVSEGSFLGIFRNVFSSEVISGAMLLSRGVDFYLLFLISGINLILVAFKNKRNDLKSNMGKKLVKEKD